MPVLETRPWLGTELEHVMLGKQGRDLFLAHLMAHLISWGVKGTRSSCTESCLAGLGWLKPAGNSLLRDVSEAHSTLVNFSEFAAG